MRTRTWRSSRLSFSEVSVLDGEIPLLVTVVVEMLFVTDVVDDDVGDAFVLDDNVVEYLPDDETAREWVGFGTGEVVGSLGEIQLTLVCVRLLPPLPTLVPGLEESRMCDDLVGVDEPLFCLVNPVEVDIGCGFSISFNVLSNSAFIRSICESKSSF